METRMTKEKNALSIRIDRRQFSAGLFGLAATAVMPGVTLAQGAGGAAAQKIADHFSSVKTMMGEFVQFGARAGSVVGQHVHHRSEARRGAAGALPCRLPRQEPLPRAGEDAGQLAAGEPDRVLPHDERAVGPGQLP